MAAVQFQDMDTLFLKIWAREMRFSLVTMGGLRNKEFFDEQAQRYPDSHTVLSEYLDDLLLAIEDRKPGIFKTAALFDVPVPESATAMQALQAIRAAAGDMTVDVGENISKFPEDEQRSLQDRLNAMWSAVTALTKDLPKLKIGYHEF